MVNTKEQRQELIKQTLENHRVRNQKQLAGFLAECGQFPNQSTMARDLKEMGIQKFQGHYELPKGPPLKEKYLSSGILNINKAGDNLLILKTLPGRASTVAAMIDELSFSSVLGTIAGDDTIFLATADKKNQQDLIKGLSHHLVVDKNIGLTVKQ